MSNKAVVVLGACGALGRTLVEAFGKRHWHTIAADFSPCDAATKSVVLNRDSDWTTRAAALQKELEAHLGTQRLDSIINVAGGWVGGSAASESLVADTETMFNQSVMSCVVAAQMAHRLGAPGCLVLLPGAAGVLGPTPSMLAYGMAKAAVHQLTASLAAKTSGLPPDAHVVCLLPVTLDTPMNRAAMPDADRSSWTPLSYVAELALEWAAGGNRPPSGSLVSLVTKDGKTTPSWR
jgi:dihydropteridine reductase